MASDEDYMSFLDKANQDASDGEALAKKQNSSSKAMFKTTDEGAQVPKVIRDACQDAVYVTDADEPFEQVSLKWSGGHGLPNEGTHDDFTARHCLSVSDRGLFFSLSFFIVFFFFILFLGGLQSTCGRPLADFSCTMLS